MDITVALGSIAQALSVAKAIRDVDVALDRATYKTQIADLLENLADVKISVLDAQEELRAKDAEIERLKAAFRINSELVAGPGDYKYRVNVDGHKIGYPMCRRCEHEGRVVQLVQNRHSHKAICPSCRTEFDPVECFIEPGPDGKEMTVRQRDQEAASQSRRVVGVVGTRRSRFDAY